MVYGDAWMSRRLLSRRRVVVIVPQPGRIRDIHSSGAASHRAQGPIQRLVDDAPPRSRKAQRNNSVHSVLARQPLRPFALLKHGPQLPPQNKYKPEA